MINALLRSHRIWAIVAAIVAAPLLPSCTAAPSDIAVNRITVKSVALSHTVHFAPGSTEIEPSEAESLRVFLRNGVARVNSITLVSGASPIDDARRASVGRVLDTLGLPYIIAPAEPTFAADAVNVAVTGEAAVLPSCPNWAAMGPYNPSNGTTSNLGCATRTNLYLMVADPRDLVSGHALTPADADPSVHAVEAYRTGDQKLNPQAPSLGDQGST